MWFGTGILKLPALSEGLPMVIRMNDLRVCGFCLDGARHFAEKHNINWVDFLTDGLDSDYLLSLDEAMATEVVERTARRRA